MSLKGFIHALEGLCSYSVWHTHLCQKLLARSDDILSLVIRAAIILGICTL